MTEATSLKGADSIKIKTAIEKFFDKNNLTAADLNGVDLNEFSRYASLGQSNPSKAKLHELYNDNLTRVLDPENKQMTSEQKLQFFEMINTSGIKINDKVKKLLREPITEKLANYFYYTRNTPITDEAKKMMKGDVANILKPLGDFAKDINSIVKDCSAEARKENNKSSFFSWMKDKVYGLLGYKENTKVKDLAKDIGSGIKDLIAKNTQGSFSKAAAKVNDLSR